MSTNGRPSAVEVREPDGTSVEDSRLTLDDSRPQVDAETVAAERDRLGRAIRDLESAKARLERDAHLVHEQTRSALVSELLPVLDNLDRAVAAAESNGDAPAVVHGVRLVRRQLEAVLHGYGLARFDATGAGFDPKVHDATRVIAVDDASQDRRVVEQLEPGYVFGDRLLRAAKVVVGKRM